MAIQTQGFQFQNLARYTPVDPTLVGVDFSRIGSGIADAMKLGSSLQQYQMRKQAMEEEQATRESRINQANAVARLNAAKAQEAFANVALMEAATREAAQTAAEREKSIRESGILRFGPEADAARAKATIALTPEKTLLDLAQIQGDRAALPLVQEAKTVGLTRQIGAGRRGILTDEQVENMSMQQQLLGLAAGGLRLGKEQAETVNIEADTRLKNAQALAASMGKARDPLPIVRELNDQIDALLKRPMVYEDGTVTNLQAYEGRMAARTRGETEGILRREIKEDATLNKYLTELNQLRSIRDRYMQSAIGETSGGGSGARGGGLGGGGMVAVTPPALGEVPAAALPALADIVNLGVTTPSAGVATAAPALAQLFSGSTGSAPAAAAPAASAPAAPVATVTIGKDGKITRDTGIPETVTELAKDYGTEAATALALLPTKQTRESVKQLVSRGALRAEALGRLLGPAIAERASQIGTGAIRAVKPAAVTNLADIYLGRIIGGKDVKGMRASEAIGAALASDTEGMVQQERIAGLLDQINNVLNSNLSRDEKLARARELQGRIDEIRSASVVTQPSAANLARYAAAAGGGGFVTSMGESRKPAAKMINIPQDQVPIININEAEGVPVSRSEAKMINIPQERPEAKMIEIPEETNDEALTDLLQQYIKSVPSASSGGSALIFPRITSTARKPKAKTIEIPEELNEEELTELLRRYFYGKTLEERIGSKFYSGR